jgi:hypothetical protein
MLQSRQQTRQQLASPSAFVQSLLRAPRNQQARAVVPAFVLASVRPMELWRQRQGRRREAPAEVTGRPDFGILLADYLLLGFSAVQFDTGAVGATHFKPGGASF